MGTPCLTHTQKLGLILYRDSVLEMHAYKHPEQAEVTLVVSCLSTDTLKHTVRLAAALVT